MSDDMIIDIDLINDPFAKRVYEKIDSYAIAHNLINTTRKLEVSVFKLKTNPYATIQCNVVKNHYNWKHSNILFRIEVIDNHPIIIFYIYEINLISKVKNLPNLLNYTKNSETFKIP